MNDPETFETLSKLKLGDPVIVYESRHGWVKRHSTYDGKVAKVGRTLITIDFKPYGPAQFHMDGGGMKANYNTGIYVTTAELAALEESRVTAIEFLRGSGFDLNYKRRPSTALLIELAEIVKKHMELEK